LAVGCQPGKSSEEFPTRYLDNRKDSDMEMKAADEDITWAGDKQIARDDASITHSNPSGMATASICLHTITP